MLRKSLEGIRELDFQGLRDAGYRGAVFDKDNCLTFPGRDSLVPQLRDAWEDCKNVFGDNVVVVVSNSAGTRDDPAGIEAESVSHSLKVPVLPHDIKKPGCLDVIGRYFSALGPNGGRPIRPSELIYVGDRLFTDVVMGNKLGGLSVWTTGLWIREAMGLRYVEYGLLRMIMSWQEFRQKGKETVSEKEALPTPQHRFVKPDPKQAGPESNTVVKIWNGSATVLRLTIVVARWLTRQIRDLYKRSQAAYMKRRSAKGSHPNEQAEEPSQQLVPARSYQILSLVNVGMRSLGRFLRWLFIVVRGTVENTMRSNVQNRQQHTK